MSTKEQNGLGPKLKYTSNLLFNLYANKSIDGVIS